MCDWMVSPGNTDEWIAQLVKRWEKTRSDGLLAVQKMEKAVSSRQRYA